MLIAKRRVSLKILVDISRRNTAALSEMHFSCSLLRVHDLIEFSHTDQKILLVLAERNCLSELQ